MSDAKFTIPSRRTIGLCEAATHLLIARESCRQATIAMHSTVADVEDDPMWGWAKEATELRNQVDELRTSVFDAMWKPR